LPNFLITLASQIARGRTPVRLHAAIVASIPMMNGSNVLEGYVPDVDATIVTRILDAGALDHTGPIARTASDAAQLLEVLAGTDGLDQRQPAGLRTEASRSPETNALTTPSTPYRMIKAPAR
jgi:Asp-tRNA(Asn)/Glu-tRNA(Gln) amidotransferase A subunit family amidase